MKHFLEQWKIKLKQNKPLHHLFLKSGKLVNNLTEIPITENILFVSRSPYFKGFRRVVTRQNTERKELNRVSQGNLNNYNSERLLSPDKQSKVFFKFYKIGE